MLIKEIRSQLEKLGNKKDAKILQRFFKTGPGEYGEGDIFMGVRVPVVRKLAKQYNLLSLKEIIELLKSPVHEERLLALLVLILQYKQADDKERQQIYNVYLKHTRYINNWDLVDLSAYHIVGAFLANKDKKPLYVLARSKMLWERRIAMLSSFHFIKQNKFNDTLKIANLLLRDKEDLIHKAVGWMLREVGNRDFAQEDAFLRKHYKRMPRVMLRYAIEKFPETLRQDYLKGKI